MGEEKKTGHESVQKRFPRIGTGVIVVKDNKILLGRRLTHGKNTWSVPGGWLEFNESFENCAARECLEETGIAVSNPKLFYTINNILREDDLHTVTVFMKGEYAVGEPVVTEPEKFVDVGWYDLDNLPSPLFYPLERLLKTEGIRLV